MFCTLLLNLKLGNPSYKSSLGLARMETSILPDFQIGLGRQEWRNAERQWKKDKLQISYEIMRDYMVSYQHSVKAMKSMPIVQRLCLVQYIMY